MNAATPPGRKVAKPRTKLPRRTVVAKPTKKVAEAEPTPVAAEAPLEAPVAEAEVTPEPVAEPIETPVAEAEAPVSEPAESVEAAPEVAAAPAEPAEEVAPETTEEPSAPEEIPEEASEEAAEETAEEAPASEEPSEQDAENANGSRRWTREERRQYWEEKKRERKERREQRRLEQQAQQTQQAQNPPAPANEKPQTMGPPTRGLTVLGSKTTVYSDQYTPAILEAFDNRHPENDFFVKFNCPEFTSLCPITGQPDFATLYISYIPDRKMVESKSLKLYLFSFRNHGAFHEDCVNIIMKDLIKLLSPRYIEVWGKFMPRGGLSIDPYANYGRPTTRWAEFASQRLLMHDLNPEKVDNR